MDKDVEACATLTGSNSNHSIQSSGKTLRDKSRRISIPFHRFLYFYQSVYRFFFPFVFFFLFQAKETVEEEEGEGKKRVERRRQNRLKWPPFYFY